MGSSPWAVNASPYCACRDSDADRRRALVEIAPNVVAPEGVVAKSKVMQRLVDLTPQTYRAEVLGVFRLTWEGSGPYRDP